MQEEHKSTFQEVLDYSTSFKCLATYFLGAAFEFDANTQSQSGGKREEGSLVSRHILVPIPAHLPPDH